MLQINKLFIANRLSINAYLAETATSCFAMAPHGIIKAELDPEVACIISSSSVYVHGCAIESFKQFFPTITCQ